ncbi:hypothetical protein B7435_27105 [Mycolicibacterium peregrinum]|nr:hypothetical protein B7435_27105 [Mycolicibacterium peregrinum]
MTASEKIRARYRAVEAQRRANEKRARNNRANVDDAASIRVLLQRLAAVDTWESTRLDQVVENIREDAARRRVSHLVNLQTVIGQMRDRGQTIASIAGIAEVEVRVLQGVLRRARASETGDQCSTRSRTGRSIRVVNGGESSSLVSAYADRLSLTATDNSKFDPNRCVRCAAVMLDPEVAPRRGRPRRYCSDTCRRDASAARTAAQRYGQPIRVVEVPRAGAGRAEPRKNAEMPAPEIRSACDAVELALHNADAMRILLSSVAKRARRKELDRATFEAARDLAKAVHPYRD